MAQGLKADLTLSDQLALLPLARRRFPRQLT
jgi:hypothetical protein